MRERDVAERERRLEAVEHELASRKLELCETEAKRETAAHSLQQAQKYAMSLETQLVEQKMKVFKLTEQLQDLEDARTIKKRSNEVANHIASPKRPKRRKSFSGSLEV